MNVEKERVYVSLVIDQAPILTILVIYYHQELRYWRWTGTRHDGIFSLPPQVSLPSLILISLVTKLEWLLYFELMASISSDAVIYQLKLGPPLRHFDVSPRQEEWLGLAIHFCWVWHVSLIMNCPFSENLSPIAGLCNSLVTSSLS